MARCQRCELRLIKAPSRRDPGVDIDFGDTCAGVWLDATELDRLETPREVSGSLLDRFLKLIDREKVVYTVFSNDTIARSKFTRIRTGVRGTSITA